eukprot:SAG31_NODE_491_length_14923_cov_12.905221_4_plen_47_part_00
MIDSPGSGKVALYDNSLAEWALDSNAAELPMETGVVKSERLGPSRL